MTEQEIYIEAMDRADPAGRGRFLDEACAGDSALRARVERLIRQSDQLGSFLEHPAVEAAVAEAGLSGDSGSDQNATVLYRDGSTEDDGKATSEEKTMRVNAQDNDDEIPLGYLQPSNKPGSLGRLGHYEVLEVVGRGAFGTVLRAFDEKLQRVVAIKVLAPEMAATSPSRKRFLREARTSAAIRHENVVAIHAVEDEPIPYLVMEYIPGQTLQQRLENHGPLSVLDVLKLGKQIADGLAAAHAQDLIHRDIKPGNILLEGGVSERVKITDFGLARTADDASMTQSGLIAGTPMYMAPEQALGHKLDQRADLFSFGSVLYQMLSGRPPFRAANTVAVLKRVVEDTPRPIQEIIPEVPTWMCELIGQLHAKDPDERIQTAKEVSDLLGRCLDDLKASRVPKVSSPSLSFASTIKHSPFVIAEPDQPPRQESPPRKPWVKVAAVALMLLAILGITEATGLTKLASTAVQWMTTTTRPAVQIPPESQPSTVITLSAGWHGWPADAPKPAIAPFDAAQAKRHQEEWATYLKVPVEYTNSIGMKFRLIPPGEFLMGSTDEEVAQSIPDAGGDELWERCFRSEAPQHRVVLTKPLYVGLHEVRQVDFETVFGRNPSVFSPKGERADLAKGLDMSRHPVENIAWAEAADFCAKLSEHEQLKPRYFVTKENVTPLQGNGYRLIREAEWEFAHRAGSIGKYAEGLTPQERNAYVWSLDNAGGRTHAVGELSPNPFGLFDMGGNVHEWVEDEWTADFFKLFANEAAIDPLGRSPDGIYRVFRGGSSTNSAYVCRAAMRVAPNRIVKLAHLGFRIALDIEAAKTLLTKSIRGQAGTDDGRPANAPKPAIAPFDTAQAKAHQEAWAKHLGVPVEYTNSIGMKFRLIPPGEFMMGSTPEEIEAALKDATVEQTQWRECIKSEAPQHKVVLTQPIYLGVTEVTQGEYQKVMGTNPSSFAPTGQHKDLVAGMDTSNQPVEMVTWNEAVEFCSKLSQQEKLKLFYVHSGNKVTALEGTGYRLPIEAEWEFACRAGTSTKYVSGDDEAALSSVCWFQSSPVHAVGLLKANPFGLYDMHGNVWEWIQDGWDASWYGRFQEKPAINPSSPFTADSLLVLRGGSWNTDASRCRASHRSAGHSLSRDGSIGFRVSLPVDAVEQRLSGKPEMTTLGAEVRSSKTTESWVSLFNGRDLTGWKTLPELPGQWEVKDGALTGTEKPSYLFSERGDFENFHLRAEVKLNGLGDSGIYFRTPFEFGHGPKAWMVFPATGYELELSDQPKPRGTIWQLIPGVPPPALAEAVRITEDDTDDWITVELIADGNRMTTRLNGREVVKGVDPVGRFRRGHFALAVTNPKTVAQFRKIEIRELPPSSPSPNPEPETRRFASDEWIDVIPLIDPKLDKWDIRQTGKNEWQVENSELIVGGSDDKPKKLLLPIDADFWPSFECELQFTRRSGEAGFNVNFPTASGDTPLSFEFPNTVGVALREFDSGKVKTTTISNKRQIETGNRTTLRVEVRRQSRGDRISVWNEETLVGIWTGDRTQLASNNSEGYPHNRRMSLWIHGGMSEFVFHRIRLRMLDWGTAHSIRSVAETPIPADTPAKGE